MRQVLCCQRVNRVFTVKSLPDVQSRRQHEIELYLRRADYIQAEIVNRFVIILNKGHGVFKHHPRFLVIKDVLCKI